MPDLFLISLTLVKLLQSFLKTPPLYVKDTSQSACPSLAFFSLSEVHCDSLSALLIRPT